MTAFGYDFDAIEAALSRPISGSEPGPTTTAGDRRDGRVFLADRNLRLAVRVALATGRPLLLRGLPGTGKSSVAAFVADRLDLRYYEIVMTSETSATDLLWRYDPVRRLADAQAASVRAHSNPTATDVPAWNYVDPGPVWWAYSPATAAGRGAPDGRTPDEPATDPDNAGRAADAVVLIDEIDKAGPDVPNALLVPLGSLTFEVTPTRRRIDLSRDANRVLIVITTNEERALPQAFVRRCVVHTMPMPGVDRMVEIAGTHDHAVGGSLTGEQEAVCRAVAGQVERLQEECRKRGQRPPGTAEFLDAWRAARDLGIAPGSDDWAFVEQVSLRKSFTDLLEEGL